jgi:hypothetical protein
MLTPNEQRKVTAILNESVPQCPSELVDLVVGKPTEANLCLLQSLFPVSNYVVERIRNLRDFHVEPISLTVVSEYQAAFQAVILSDQYEPERINQLLKASLAVVSYDSQGESFTGLSVIIGHAIRDARSCCQMTQRSVSDRFDISIRLLSKIESGSFCSTDLVRAEAWLRFLFPRVDNVAHSAMARLLERDTRGLFERLHTVYSTL